VSTIPFTYYLYHIPTGKKYYGSRYRRGCDPSDIWTTYFTSSILVEALIKEYGKDSFIAEVRKTFTTAKEAVAWEQRVLKRLRVTKREDWLNRASNSIHFICEMTDEVRKKLSDANMGKTLPREQVERTAAKIKGQRRSATSKKKMSEQQRAAGGYGPKTHTEETKIKIGKAFSGKPKTEEQKKKMSDSAKVDRQKRRDSGWKMPPEDVARRAEMKRGKTRPIESVTKMREKKKGTKRHYLPDGSFIMIRPNQEDQ
jgi:hypothetical protein